METRITFNGQTYDSLESMPPDVRQQYQAVLNALSGDDRAKVASLLQGGAGIRINTTVKEIRTTSTPAPTDSEGEGTGTMWRAAIFAAMAAVVIAWLLLRH